MNDGTGMTPANGSGSYFDHAPHLGASGTVYGALMGMHSPLSHELTVTGEESPPDASSEIVMMPGGGDGLSSYVLTPHHSLP